MILGGGLALKKPPCTFTTHYPSTSLGGVDTCTASLMAAKSTTAGTPVKSCKITRAGINGTSTLSPLNRMRLYYGLSLVLVSRRNIISMLLLGLSLLPVENLLNILLQNLEVVTVPDCRLKKDSDWERQLFVFLPKSWQVEEGFVLSSYFKRFLQVNIWVSTTSHCVIWKLCCDNMSSHKKRSQVV